ncbi:transglutaminaseTgpA domain-containing protein [Paenibacillus sp. VCA1]|uniref:transglutaminase family protein n=1 Tax=Paenibacillus sp. VCA1 TaxID=3039148 RepID=UPI002871487C|nr:transglutaminaseTgpA domain-containing protein [Paenibacillus sp. VCA1]MDR9852637.1 transglutaminaseTgpA domain-containing protein [Paenibacillus sp. VCA1]
MDNGKDPLWFRLGISALLMGLFLEWLMPLQPLDVLSVSREWFGVMYVFTGALLLLGAFCLRLPLLGPLYLFCTLAFWAVVIARSGEPFDPVSSLSLLRQDVELLASTGSFGALSQDARMLVLMIGWALLVYSVQSLALLRSSVLLFAGATLLYLFCLETLLSLSVYGDIIKTSALVLLLQGMVHLSRLRESGPVFRIPKPEYGRWGLSLAAVVLFVVAVSWLAGSLAQPKAAAAFSLQQAADRLANWVKTGYGAGEAAAVTGYNLSGEEEEMGLPLQQSSRVYFTAQTPFPTYWRGETFSEYNGRKWSEVQSDVKTGYAPGTIPEQTDKLAPEQRTITQKITFEQPLRQSFPLFGGGRVAEIVDMQLSPDGAALPAAIERNVDAGTVRVMLDGGQPQIEGYTVKVAVPDPNPERLKQESGADPLHVRERYLQLPEELPQRVKDLAAEITKGAGNRYDRVYAVLIYLKEHESYSLDTKVPPAGKDFVDDFLFATHAGYCNHFSTAMAVLLRSEGIPARYVKGFAPGKQEAGKSGTYLITEGDAHAWVEVYFPESGWIPFDPTPGIALTGGSTKPASSFHAAATGGDFLKNVAGYALLGFRLTLQLVLEHKLAFAIGTVLTGALALAILGLLPWLGLLPLWLQLYVTRRHFPGRNELLKSANPVWKALTRRFGAAPAGCTAREYIRSLPVEKEEIRKMLYDFAADWEMIAYDEGPMKRSRCVAFLRRCFRISKKVA